MERRRPQLAQATAVRRFHCMLVVKNLTGQSRRGASSRQDGPVSRLRR